MTPESINSVGYSFDIFRSPPPANSIPMTTKTHPPPSIAIVGAGPSGLLFARLLEVNGFKNYVVYERDESSTPGIWQQGGSLDLHGPSGQQALKEAGLFDEFNEVYARWNASQIKIVRSSGEIAVCFGEGRNAPEIDRLQLRQLLLGSIPAQKIKWNHNVSCVERDENSYNDMNKYVIRFTNGSSATGFKLIVGADGGWSRVRPLVSQTIQREHFNPVLPALGSNHIHDLQIISANPVYSGKLYIEGKISRGNKIYKTAYELAGPGLMMAVDSTGLNRTLALQQGSDASYRMYLGIIVPRDFYEHRNDKVTEKSEALRRLMLSSDKFYANWAPQFKSVLDNAEGPFRAWSLHYLRPEEVNWSRDSAPGVTLLGDAAHLSTPFVGEGVNCAMYDAVVLSQRLVEFCGKNSDLTTVPSAKLEKALASYEEEMFVRGQDLIQRSNESEAMFFGENAVDNVLGMISGGPDELFYDVKASA